MPITQPSLLTRHSLLMRLRDSQDQEAWLTFVAAYAPVIYRFLLKQGVQDADALDVSQDVLVSVAADIGKFEPCEDRSGSFRKWLFTIVRSRMIDHRRRGKKQPCGSGDSRVEQVLSEISAAGDGLEEQWASGYFETVFHAAANQVRADFQPSTWQAFWRTTFEDEAPANRRGGYRPDPEAVYLAKRRVLLRIQKQIDYLEGELI